MSNKKGVGYIEEPLFETHNSKVLCFYGLKRGHNKKMCLLLKIKKVKKPSRTYKK